MQYHLNGFSGSLNPLTYRFPGASPTDYQTTLPQQVDILIIGAGPAGHLLATQLARFPFLKTRLISPLPGPLEIGQADGLQCRSLEVFQAFGFADQVCKEAYWVNETTFWSPDPATGEGLMRTGRIRDTEEGLSEFPHVILNQARLHGLWLDAMKGSETRLEPTYNRALKGLKIPDEEDGAVEVEVERTDAAHKGEVEKVRAKFVVGCDGARSLVRSSLGLEMRGDFANQAWGVLDALVETDFPDLRLKTAIHSASAGSVLIIPREGGYLARFYIELDKLPPGERIARDKITADVLVSRAQAIFKPYHFSVRHIGYWSVYEVGQRLTDHFDDVPPNPNSSTFPEKIPRVFIAGDACHTHSAKAGQGMNVSMNDTFNLGWKLASVLHNHTKPAILHTYSFERQAIAQLLIDFDREISRQFAAKPQHKPSQNREEEGEGIDPAVFQRYFQRQGRFMAGLETRYSPSMITSAETSHQHLATGFPIGERFHSAQVLRLADAKPVQLGHVMEADGRWRVVILSSSAPSPLSPGSELMDLCAWLEKNLIPRYTPSTSDPDSLLDVRCVLPHSRRDLDVGKLPEVLLPHKGKFGIQDYEKVFTDEESYGFGFGDIYKTRGVDRERGCIIVVRPDQYVSGVWPLSKEGREGVEKFFEGVLVPVSERASNGTAAPVSEQAKEESPAPPAASVASQYLARPLDIAAEVLAGVGYDM